MPALAEEVVMSSAATMSTNLWAVTAETCMARNLKRSDSVMAAQARSFWWRWHIAQRGRAQSALVTIRTRHLVLRLRGLGAVSCVRELRADRPVLAEAQPLSPGCCPQLVALNAVGERRS